MYDYLSLGATLLVVGTTRADIVHANQWAVHVSASHPTLVEFWLIYIYKRNTIRHIHLLYAGMFSRRPSRTPMQNTSFGTLVRRSRTGVEAKSSFLGGMVMLTTPAFTSATTAK